MKFAYDETNFHPVRRKCTPGIPYPSETQDPPPTTAPDWLAKRCLGCVGGGGGDG